MPANSISSGCLSCRGGLASDDNSYLGQVNGYGIHQCASCRLVFVYPKPTEQELDKIYSGYHERTNQWELNHQGEITMFESVLNHIVAKGISQGELLDVGASFGHFLALARSRGFQPKGVEIGAEASQYAREQLHLDVECKHLEQAGFADNRFDAVTMLNVLEHVPNPFATLRECYRITRPGGVLAVVVPNLLLAYPYFRLTRAFGFSGPVPTSAFHVPFHLTLFGPDSLRRMFRDVGWETLELVNAEVIKNPGILQTTAKRLAKGMGDALHWASYGRLMVGYSQLLVARKPA